MDVLDEMTVEEDADKDQKHDEDEGEFESPLSARKIYSDQGNLEIRSLHAKKFEGDLILQPDFQRGFVWDSTKCSRLIESALLGIPIPILNPAILWTSDQLHPLSSYGQSLLVAPYVNTSVRTLYASCLRASRRLLALLRSSQ